MVSFARQLLWLIYFQLYVRGKLPTAAFTSLANADDYHSVSEQFRVSLGKHDVQ